MIKSKKTDYGPFFDIKNVKICHSDFRRNDKREGMTDKKQDADRDRQRKNVIVICYSSPRAFIADCLKVSEIFPREILILIACS